MDTTLERQPYSINGNESIIGQSSVMDNIFRTIGQLENCDATVLIQGETGTGKELVARALHYNSHKKEKPFIPINCADLPDQLLESELFGYKQGAFTGAFKSKMGLLKCADHGTIFLDEISEMNFNLQAKLLRFLDRKEFFPIGSISLVVTDARVIAATNQDASKAVKEGKLREDLYYRLNVIPIYIPPLRERRGDIPLLAKYFMNRYCQEYDVNLKEISPEALEILSIQSWKGNVRELQNIIHRSVIKRKTNNHRAPILTQDDLLFDRRI